MSLSTLGKRLECLEEVAAAGDDPEWFIKLTGKTRSEMTAENWDELTGNFFPD